MFIDIDISINFDFIEKCLLYTKKGETVYFPVVFSTFNPGLSDKRRRKKDFVISVNHGVWRMVGYGNLCVYKTDYVFIGGYNTSITGWGWEDTELYQRYGTSVPLLLLLVKSFDFLSNFNIIGPLCVVL